ncbi:hypothetical protein [Fodinicola feengrottensis]|uniref:hypothetical protein n=1 Tax=Fodinicola feengrottensis TaxID=435914 RepID=UPI002440F4FD|nr:hypothetical protein [Fodinicola feengrottensis]
MTGAEPPDLLQPQVTVGARRRGLDDRLPAGHRLGDDLVVRSRQPSRVGFHPLAGLFLRGAGESGRTTEQDDTGGDRHAGAEPEEIRPGHATGRRRFLGHTFGSAEPS